MNPKPTVDLPLSPLDFSILVVLAQGASYGYGIMKAMSEPSNGGLELAPGNIYQALDRLISRGWIHEVPETESPADADPRRRYYGITQKGREAAAAEASRLHELHPALERLVRIRGNQA